MEVIGATDLRRMVALSAGSVLLTSPVAGRAQAAMTAPEAPSAEAGLVAAEDARFAALVHKDMAAVAAGLADDLVYVHATGRRQTKTEYLNGLLHGPATYLGVSASARTAKVFGDVGFTRAIYSLVLTDRIVRSSYLAVYVKRVGRWQLLSWQTTPDEAPIPAPSTTPAH